MCFILIIVSKNNNLTFWGKEFAQWKLWAYIFINLFSKWFPFFTFIVQRWVQWFFLFSCVIISPKPTPIHIVKVLVKIPVFISVVWFCLVHAFNCEIDKKNQKPQKCRKNTECIICIIIFIWVIKETLPMLLEGHFCWASKHPLDGTTWGINNSWRISHSFSWWNTVKWGIFASRQFSLNSKF